MSDTTPSIQYSIPDHAYFQVCKVRPTAIIPTYGSEHAAGMDLSACMDEELIITPGAKSVLIPTGLAIWIKQPGIFGLITARSGLGHKKGLVLGNGVGVIDSDYQGEIFVSVCVRPGHDPVVIAPNDRIAQYILLPFARLLNGFTEVAQFTQESERGTGGFGSTGTSS